MKLKRAISSLILAIYLVASCGGALSVILCHCSRSQHIQTHHSSCQHCQHCQGEGIKYPSDCGCHHDHSTEIDLYNYEKLSVANIAPMVCSILPSMQEQAEPVAVQTVTKLFYRRKTPLLVAEYVSLSGLRAPPVIA